MLALVDKFYENEKTFGDSTISQEEYN